MTTPVWSEEHDSALSAMVENVATLPADVATAVHAASKALTTTTVQGLATAIKADPDTSAELRTLSTTLKMSEIVIPKKKRLRKDVKPRKEHVSAARAGKSSCATPEHRNVTSMIKRLYNILHKRPVAAISPVKKPAAT